MKCKAGRSARLLHVPLSQQNHGRKHHNLPAAIPARRGDYTPSAPHHPIPGVANCIYSTAIHTSPATPSRRPRGGSLGTPICRANCSYRAMPPTHCASHISVALHGKGSLPATTSQQPCAVLCTVRRNVPGCRNYKSPCLKRTSIAYSCYGDRARLTTAASRLVPAIENQSLALEGSNYVLQMSP